MEYNIFMTTLFWSNTFTTTEIFIQSKFTKLSPFLESQILLRSCESWTLSAENAYTDTIFCTQFQMVCTSVSIHLQI